MKIEEGSSSVFRSAAAAIVQVAAGGVAIVEFFRKHGLLSYLGLPLITKEKVLRILSVHMFFSGRTT